MLRPGQAGKPDLLSRRRDSLPAPLYRPLSLRATTRASERRAAERESNFFPARSLDVTAFPILFSPIRVGPRPLKNRICCSAHADALAEDGMPTEPTVRYYETKARGGAGFIMCFGSASVHPTSPARDWNGVELFDDRVIPHLRTLSETMNRYGVQCVAKINLGGRRGSGG